MKINIVNKSKLVKISDAIIYFEQNVYRILDEIENLKPKVYFTYCDKTNIEIVEQLRKFLNSNQTVIISTYKPRWPWSKVIGYSKGNKIYINRRKLKDNDFSFYAGNLLHEICHVADFSHGNNYITEKKKYSVPYFLGYMMSGRRKLSDLLESPYNE